MLMSIHEKNIHALQAQQRAIKNIRKDAANTTPEDWALQICDGDVQKLSQAISLAESALLHDIILAKNIINACGKKKALRIGVTGIPGVGKSTFINVLAQRLQCQDTKIAVLAIDPSSEHTGGSILGDKTRMGDIATSEKIFIRPTATGNYLGGLHPATMDVCHLCEAAGYDFILIETVGVGQSEHHIAHIADINLLLLVPNAGDELQGLKSGIVEQSDAIIINKADKASIKQAQTTLAQYSKALRLRTTSQHLPIFMVSSEENTGFDAIYEYIYTAKNNSHTYDHRDEDEIYWTRLQLEHQILKSIHENPKYASWVKKNLEEKDFETLFDIKKLLQQL